MQSSLWCIKFPATQKKKRKPTKRFPKKIFFQRELFVVTAAAGAVCCQNLRWQKGREKIPGPATTTTYKKKKSFFQQQQQQKIHKIKKYKTYGVSCFEMIYAHRHLSSAKSPQERKPVSLFPSRHQSLSFFFFLESEINSYSSVFDFTSGERIKNERPHSLACCC